MSLPPTTQNPGPFWRCVKDSALWSGRSDCPICGAEGQPTNGLSEQAMTSPGPASPKTPEPVETVKYRKKPVEIEAMQFIAFDGLKAQAILDWAAGAVSVHEGDPVPERPSILMVATLEGVMTAGNRDWIIRGVKGEFYPCKPDIFEATYEAVDPPAKAPTPDETVSDCEVCGPVPLPHYCDPEHDPLDCPGCVPGSGCDCGGTPSRGGHGHAYSGSCTCCRDVCGGTGVKQ